MSGRGQRNNKHIKHAVAFLLRCQGASVPEAMSAAKFILEESLNTARQMAVRCTYTKAICGNTKSRRQWKVPRCHSYLCLPSLSTLVRCCHHCRMLPSLSLLLLSLCVVGRGSGPQNENFSNGPIIISECSNLP
jgi:hypothetical protein